MLLMFRANNDIIRHKILKVWEHRVLTDHSPYVNLGDWWETPETICKKANITLNQYHRAKSILDQNHELGISFDKQSLSKVIEKAIILEKGATSLNENKYRKFVWDKRVTKIKNFLSITVWIITIATALGSLVFAFQSMDSNQKRIRELEKEVQYLKAQNTIKPIKPIK
jgi:hypothetical protein